MRSEEPGKDHERATVRVPSAASMFGDTLRARLTGRTAGRDTGGETVLLVCEDCRQGYVAALPGKQKVEK